MARSAAVAKFAFVRLARATSRAALIASVSLIGLAASGVLGGQDAAAQDAPQTLPGTQILPGGRWTGARLPTVAQTNNGLVMTIKQEQKAALLDWSQFDIGSSEEVIFDQGGADWIALNRIFNANPTQIAGKITAKGQVWLSNTNGVIFKGASRINTQSILVTTTLMPDDILQTGILGPHNREGGGWGAISGLLYGGKGDIVIEDGAKLVLKSTDPTVASKAVFLGVNVINNGEVDVTDGQVLMMAGEQFVFRNYADGLDFSFTRGTWGLASTAYPTFGRYLNEANYDRYMADRAAEIGMRVVNNGVIRSTRGNVFLQGAEVQQNGTILSTTGVRQRSGSIVIRAGFGFDDAELNYSGTFDHVGGKIVLGENSVTQVTPEPGDDSSPALETFTGANRSRITMTAASIAMEKNSVVRATSGLVTIDANVSALNAGDFQGTQSGQPGAFSMAEGALIDVSGLRNVQFDVDDNIVQVEARSNELAGSPRQRDGILYGEDVNIDVRRGASIVDWTGALANRNQTAEQRSVNGGEVQIRALRSVRIADGAKIDISGGSADYAGGMIDYTQLTAADGRVFDIADADPGLKYVGLSHGQRYETGYSEGGDAGRLEILSSSQVLFGRVVSNVYNGERQIAGGLKGFKPVTPAGANEAVPTTRLAKGGEVQISTSSESLNEYFVDQVFITPGQGPVTLTVNGGEVVLDPTKLDESGYLTEGGYTLAYLGIRPGDPKFRLAPGWVLVDGQPAELRAALVARGYEGDALEALLQPDAALPAGFQRGEARRFTFIDDDFASGVQTLSLNDKADAWLHYWNIQPGSNLWVKPGGSLTIGGTPADVGDHVTLTARGGTINLNADRIGAGSVLSVAGTWVNDLDNQGQFGGYVDGGRLQLFGTYLDGDITLDASGGGWWKRTSPDTASGPGGFDLVGGKGGSILAIRNEAQGSQEYLDRAGFKLGGLGGFGALDLQNMGDIVIGPDGGTAPTSALYLSNSQMNAWGLGSLNLGGGQFTMAMGGSLLGRVAINGVVNPTATSVEAPDYYLVKPGEIITAEKLALINAANTAADEYNAALPPGSPMVGLVASVVVAGSVDVVDGARVDMKRQNWTLIRPAANIATGADLSQNVTSVVYPDHLRGGASLGLGSAGHLRIAEDAIVQVDPGGTIALGGAFLDLAGDLIARGGTITVDSSSTGRPSLATIHSTAMLDARGIALTRRVDGSAPGESWIEGKILGGGSISVSADHLLLEKGALLDVSGASGMLTVSAPTRIGTSRINRLIGSDGGTISIFGADGYLLGDLRGAAGTPAARAGILNIGGGGLGQGPDALMLEQFISAMSENAALYSTFGPFATLQDLAVSWYGYAPESIEPIPITDLDALRGFLNAAFAPARGNDVNGYLALDPTLDAAGSMGGAGGAGFQPAVPDGYVLQTDQAAYVNALKFMLENFIGASYRDNFVNMAPGTTFHVGKAPLEAAASFDSVNLGSGGSSSGGTGGAIRVDADLALKALRELRLTAMSAPSADVTLEAPTITFVGGGVARPTGGSSSGGEFTALADIINIEGATFDGFSKVTLVADRSLSGGSIIGDFNGQPAYASIYAPGELIIRAGQVYPYTGKALGIFSDTSITFEGTGHGGAAPLSAGGRLVIGAPTINQGGVLAAPFGQIEFEGQQVNFLSGSLTMVSADDRTILYGNTIDGSNWYGPRPDEINGDVELNTPPEKRITIIGDNVDLQEGAVIDASGGGDVLGLEFVQGPQGSINILSGPGVFAISTALGADVSLGQAPSGAPRSELAVGDVVWLPAFDGNPAGYYTLLPAEYALTPGGYRITTAQAGPSASVARASADGAIILAGYQAGEQGQAYTDQNYTTFSLFSGAEVRQRSEFIETSGNTFFSSERFLTGLERSGGVFNANPRLPIDGGFMTIAARQSLQLNGRFEAGGANANSRGGILDIAGDHIVIASAGTDVSDLVGYLRLDPGQLSGVAESLLIGGVRRQGAGGLEIVTGYEGRVTGGGGLGSTIGAERIVVRNGESDALTGPEILFAATDEIVFESGSVVRAVGDGFQAPDVLIRPELPAGQVVDPWPPVNYPAEDRGAFVRVSNLGDVSITRNSPFTDRGDITVEAGARLEATDAVALNATRNTTLQPGAVIKAGAIEAAAGQISFGDAPAATNGLVLTQTAFEALSTAQVLRLRSLTDFKLYGDVTLSASNNLILDGGGIVDVDGAGANSFTAKTLTLTNTLATVDAPVANTATLALGGETIIRGAGDISLSFADVAIDAKGRMLFTGAGETDTLGDLTIRASQITAEGGAAHTIDADGDLALLSQDTLLTLTDLETAGASLDFFGQTVRIDLQIALASGVVRATAIDDLTVGAKGRIDASGSAIAFFEKTEYLGAGGIGLSSENGDVIVDAAAVLDVSGGTGGGDAGSIVLSASRGVAVLDGTLRGGATGEFRGGQFSLSTSTLADFGALNAKLNDSGFSRLRRFSIVDGDAVINGVTRVETFELSTGSGSVTVADGAQIITTGDKGGKILIASGGDLMVSDGALLDASANGGDQRGGDIVLQVGDNGEMSIGAATLDVSAAGQGQAGEVRLRARQVGNDVAVSEYAANVIGGVTQLEAYRVTDLGAGDGIIDAALQMQVTDQAAAFMAAASAGIRTRLGQPDTAAFIISPGIEIRAGGDLTLVDNWNLKDARYNGAAGVLTLRAGGDLNIDNANLSDGFVDAVRTQEYYAPTELNGQFMPLVGPTPPNKLTNDTSWTYNLVAGADFSQTNVLSTVVSASGEGDINLDGMVRTGTGDINVAASGDLIYAQPDVWTYSLEVFGPGGLPILDLVGPDGQTFNYTAPDNVNANYVYELDVPGLGKVWLRPGDRTLTLADGREMFNDRRDGQAPPSAFAVNNASIYTAGVDAPEVADFDTPTGYGFNPGSGRQEGYYFKPHYTYRGGDVNVKVGGSILAVDNPLESYDWAWWRGQIVPGGTPNSPVYADADQPFAPIVIPFQPPEAGNPFPELNQSSTSMLFDSFRQSMGALGGGDVTLAVGGDAVNMSVALPTSIRVSGGRTVGATKTLHVDGGGDLEMDVGGDIDGGWFYVSKGKSDIRADGAIGAGSAGVFFVIDDTKLKVQAGGALRIGQVQSGGLSYKGPSGRPQFGWLSYTENTSAEFISLGGDVTYRGIHNRAIDQSILPSFTRMVAPNGSVNFGDATQGMPRIIVDQFPAGRLEVLARQDITFYSPSQDVYTSSFVIGWRSPDDVGRVLNPVGYNGGEFTLAGAGYDLGGGPNARSGHSEFSAFYALEGDIISVSPTGNGNGGPLYNIGTFQFGHETRLKAGDDIRMGAMQFYNQDADDVSVVQAEGSIYLPDISGFGGGRIWVQSGDEIYMGNTAGRGIRSIEVIDSDPLTEPVNGVDITVLTGIDQTPEYDSFLDFYLGTGDLGGKPQYLSEYFTFDAIGLGTPHPTMLADGATETTIYAVDLVNYWNEMHGRPPLNMEDDTGRPIARGTLVAQISKADYEAAQAWFQSLDPVKQRPLATRIMFAEVKTGGREAVGSSTQTDPSLTRNGDPSRGYAAIGKLFPGAQRKPGEEKAEGEARWFGDLIMTNSQIRTDGGGDIEILAPGGMVQLASLGVTNTDPNASGVLSQDRGNLNVLTYGDYIVNQSRTMTADGGDILIWSSYGDIDAGKGRKTSLSIPPIVFPMDSSLITRVVRAGLPNGAGIATLNQVDGALGGDVDLYAFNGIVNAGDAGIRASRDLFVGALEIRGLDNITVGGVTNVELNTEEAELGPINLENFAQAAEDDALAKAFDMSAEVEKLRTVSQTILTGSVVSFGEEPGEDRRKKK
jgi:filamentous hemagglutinin family protein